VRPPAIHRRRFLHHASGLTVAAAGAAVLPLVARPARAAVRGEHSLAFAHTHTRERVVLAFAHDGQFVPEALTRLNHFLRDHYSGEVGRMDPQLFELLHRVQRTLGHEGPYEVISAYRCPATNTRLRAQGGGGVATRSLHMDGKAIDVRLPGVPLEALRDAALELRAGGVGYYASQQFVHVDTGRVRRW
jgi:uncharacterized protein YcbK (DUF882 family)